MFFLQEYQHVHLLWFKKRSFTSVWKPNPPLRYVRCVHLRARADARVKAQWARTAPALHTRRFCAAPALHTRRFCAASALHTRAVWNGRKPGSTEALVLKAPLFTWSVKSFSCYNVLQLAARALEQRRPCQIFTRTLSKNGRSLEPCIYCIYTHIRAKLYYVFLRSQKRCRCMMWYDMIMWILMFSCLLLFAHVKLIPGKQMLVF